MFGISTFADAPFAALAGGAVYSSAVTETATATDSDVGFISFLTSITETGTATDALL